LVATVARRLQNFHLVTRVALRMQNKFSRPSRYYGPRCTCLAMWMCPLCGWDVGGHPRTLDTPSAVWLHKWPLGYKACPHSIHQRSCGYTGGPLVTMVAHSWMQHLPAQQQGPPRYYGPPCVCLAMWNCPFMSNLMSFDAVRGQLLVGTTWEITTHWMHHMPCGYTSGPLADVPVAPCGHM
jgi:hypothetical protein